ncbi:hypothetical protein P879_10092 [Paragonimus westermani]|uniref:Uncharacterized protein n=1 Tax=Paragonimus westermani TaxID=34504 RepID=A0A8T0D8I7_9TREM|nr:hypothetical protein P879_10092 [Paragonimus westermani]
MDRPLPSISLRESPRRKPAISATLLLDERKSIYEKRREARASSFTGTKHKLGNSFDLIADTDLPSSGVFTRHSGSYLASSSTKRLQIRPNLSGCPEPKMDVRKRSGAHSIPNRDILKPRSEPLLLESSDDL